MSDELREKVAKALFSAQNNVDAWERISPGNRDYWRILAADALAVPEIAAALARPEVPAALPEGMTPDGEGERQRWLPNRGRRKLTLREYLSGNFDAPEKEYAAAKLDAVTKALKTVTAERDALAARPAAPMPDVPDGYEVLVVPKEVVDEFAENRADTITIKDTRLLSAARDAVARRPKTEPRVERVPWWEAVGRRYADNAEEIRELRASPRGVEVWTYPSGWVVGYETGEDPLPMDGTVEVLVVDP